MIRLVIVASVLALRAGLRALLNTDPDFVVIAEAPSLSALADIPDDIDVMILTEEVLSIVELRRILHLTDSNFAILILSDDFNVAQGIFDLSLRTWGIMPQDSTAEEMIAAIHALSEGLLVGPPSLLEPVLTRLVVARDSEISELIEPLTERESEVLQLLAQGLANKQIAIKLHISEHTVKFHVSSIYGKLGATNRTEAVRLGVQQGLIIL